MRLCAAGSGTSHAKGGKLSKTHLVAKHADKFSVWRRDVDGYWLSLHYGWQAAPHTYVHQIHGVTVAEVVADARDVCSCDCLECRTQGEQWEDIDIETGELRVYRRSEG